MPMHAFHADQFVLSLPPRPRSPMSKYRRLREQLEGMPGSPLCQALPASAGELTLAHTPGYLGAVIDDMLSSAQQREIGLPCSLGLAGRERRVFEVAREPRIPVALSMAGGCGRVVEDTVRVHLGTIRAAIDSWRQWNNATP